MPRTKPELPRSTFDQCEVTKALWDEVYNWAATHGYSFECGAQGDAAPHPAHSMTWYDAVKWCNARSEKEGRVPAYYTRAARRTVYRRGRIDLQNDCVRWNTGYRLPTEAEWEEAARGGFANHYVYQPSCDLNPTAGIQSESIIGDAQCRGPAWHVSTDRHGVQNGYCYVMEWCWDWYAPDGPSPGNDPRGPACGAYRVLRGGLWFNLANGVWCAYRNYIHPGQRNATTGFRCCVGGGVGIRRPFSKTFSTLTIPQTSKSER